MFALFSSSSLSELPPKTVYPPPPCFISVQFRTTPMDSTGVPHILEHTVLCGSEKYPCRDPFFKMLNRSLSTFMNAFTGVQTLQKGFQKKKSIHFVTSWFPFCLFVCVCVPTASDFTMYPFSTQNGKDFQNLLSVYLDAVFFPCLREQDFRSDSRGGATELRSHQVPFALFFFSFMGGGGSSFYNDYII